MHNDLTPTERQAAMIADLKARLELANERNFFIASQNARLRAALSSSLFAATANDRRALEKLLDEPPYPAAA